MESSERRQLSSSWLGPGKHREQPKADADISHCSVDSGFHESPLMMAPSASGKAITSRLPASFLKPSRCPNTCAQCWSEAVESNTRAPGYIRTNVFRNFLGYSADRGSDVVNTSNDTYLPNINSFLGNFSSPMTKRAGSIFQLDLVGPCTCATSESLKQGTWTITSRRIPPFGRMHGNSDLQTSSKVDFSLY